MVSKKKFAEKDYVLECIEGENEQGRAVFAYVLLSKKRLDALHKAMAAGDTDLGKYGLVVASGEGPKPSAEFEQKLIATLRKEQKF